MASTESITLATSDGEQLQAELFVPESPRATIVVAHPNPLMGGDMHTPVPAALFGALQGLGAAGVRFNFRGVGQSTGSHDKGQAERLDVVAAIDAAVAAAPGVPVLLSGWSFGADVSLAVDDERVAGWFLAAAPMKVLDHSTMAARTSPAPKRFAVPEHDQFAPPPVVDENLASWTNATAVTVPGADHFFGGVMDSVVDLFTEFVVEFAGSPPQP